MLREKPQVLIVDDNRTMRLMIHKSLEEAGFDVIEADSGERALEMFSQTHPDVILLDVEMMGIDGYLTCAELRKLPDCRYTPIMMVTSHGEPAAIQKAFDAGATEFTVKPVNWDILGHRVHYMVRTSRNFLELQTSELALSQAKQALEKNNQELEMRVLERTKQLNQTTEELQVTLDSLRIAQTQLIESEKTAILGDLVEGIAREVSSPIDESMKSIVKLDEQFRDIKACVSANILKRSELRLFLDQTEIFLEAIQNNLERAAELIKNFKQLSIDKTTEICCNFRLKEYIDEILFSLRPVLNDTRLTIEIHCPEDLMIDSYPNILFRILMTLITNSIKHGYGPNEQGRIVLDVSSSDDKITLRYSDTGKGISEYQVSKIFEPSFTTTHGRNSVGLGLYLVHSQVTSILGGTISCESALGRGVKFTITLPKMTPS